MFALALRFFFFCPFFKKDREKKKLYKDASTPAASSQTLPPDLHDARTAQSSRPTVAHLSSHPDCSAPGACRPAPLVRRKPICREGNVLLSFGALAASPRLDIAYPVSDNGDSLEEGAWRSCRALFFARGEPSRGFESCRPWNLFLQSLVFLLASIGFYRLLQTSTDFHPQPHIFLSLAISRLPDACQTPARSDRRPFEPAPAHFGCRRLCRLLIPYRPPSSAAHFPVFGYFSPPLALASSAAHFPVFGYVGHIPGVTRTKVFGKKTKK